MSVIERGTVSSEPFVPEEWKDQYTDIVVVPGDNFGEEQYYGIERDTGDRTPIPSEEWEDVYMGAIRESYGSASAPIRWSTKEVEGFTESPEAWKLHKEAATLRWELASSLEREKKQKDQIDVLTNSNRTHETRLNQLDTELRALRQALKDIAPDYKLPTEAGSGFNSSPQPVEVRTDNNNWESGWVTVPGPTTSGVSNQELIHVEKDGEHKYLPEDEIRSRTPVIAGDDAPRLDEPFQKENRWNRLRRRVGESTLGWQVRAHNGTYRALDRRGRVVNEIDDTVVAREYIESERRTGTVVLVGAVAVLGAGILGWLLAKHTGHDPSSEINEIISQNNTIKGQNSQLLSEVEGLKSQHAKDDSTINAMSERIRDIKQTVKNNHSILVELKRDEAREAMGGVTFSGGTHTESLRFRGDTIWNHAENLVERRGGSRSNTDLVRRVTSKILSLNGLRWDSGGPGVDAHKLPLGLRIKVPNRIA